MKHVPIPNVHWVRYWWRKWRFYLQSCGHMVHSHYIDMCLHMLSAY